MNIIPPYIGTVRTLARLSALTLGLALSVAVPRVASAAFGVTTSGANYIVDNGANLVFTIATTSADIWSIKYKGTEYQDQTHRSHVESGFGTTGVTVTASTVGSVILIKAVGPYNSGTCTQYYIVQNGVDNIYMATYVDANAAGELRWIGYINSPITWRPPGMAERTAASGATVIEASDTFVNPDGTTSSKYMGCQMAKDLNVLGTHGSAFGVYMAFGNRESSAGGPFFRDIQTCDTVVYNYLFSEHHMPENQRLNVLYGPYALMFVSGTAVPTTQPDYSFISSLGLTGYVPASSRGRVVLNGLSGMDPNYIYTMGFSGSSAQYWTTLNSSGGGEQYDMKPGSYAMTIYKGQLEVWTGTTTVTAGSATTVHTLAITNDPSTISTIWRIGNWDGTPLEFHYGAQQTDGFPDINVMHPSDVRESWTPATFTVGSSSVSTVFPAEQFRDQNGPTTIKFNLTAAQLAAHTVKIGITDAYASGRPAITVNSWTSANPSAPIEPAGRCFTIGTYRGNNTIYSFSVPASAFVVGQNTMTINIISGASTTGWLSGSVAYDCVELDN